MKLSNLRTRLAAIKMILRSDYFIALNPGGARYAIYPKETSDWNLVKEICEKISTLEKEKS